MESSCSKKKNDLLRREISSYFYCFNCLPSFRKKNKLESHKNVCENKDFCGVVMSFEDTKM